MEERSSIMKGMHNVMTLLTINRQDLVLDKLVYVYAHRATWLRFACGAALAQMFSAPCCTVAATPTVARPWGSPFSTSSLGQ